MIKQICIMKFTQLKLYKLQNCSSTDNLGWQTVELHGQISRGAKVICQYKCSILYKLLFTYTTALGWPNIHSLDPSAARVNRNWTTSTSNCTEKGLDFSACSILSFSCRFLPLSSRFPGIGDPSPWSWKHITLIIGVFTYDDISIHSQTSMFTDCQNLSVVWHLPE